MGVERVWDWVRAIEVIRTSFPCEDIYSYMIVEYHKGHGREIAHVSVILKKTVIH